MFPAPTLVPSSPTHPPHCEFRFSDQQQSDPLERCTRTQRSPAQNHRASSHAVQVPTTVQGFPHSLPGTLPDLTSCHPALAHPLHPAASPTPTPQAQQSRFRPQPSAAQCCPFPCMESSPAHGPLLPPSRLPSDVTPQKSCPPSPSSLSMSRLCFSPKHLSLPHILESLSVHLLTVGLPTWRSAPCSLLPPCLEHVWRVVGSQEACVGRVNGDEVRLSPSRQARYRRLQSLTQWKRASLGQDVFKKQLQPPRGPP